MEDVGAVLIKDIQANMGLIQAGVFGVSALLAVVGSILAFRAAALLNDARETYWRTHQAIDNLAASNPNLPGSHSYTGTRGTTAIAPSRKLRGRKNTDVLW